MQDDLLNGALTVAETMAYTAGACFVPQGDRVVQ
jgi:hypothetical protein